MPESEKKKVTEVEKDLFQAIGRRLRQVRESKGYTIGDLVEKAKDRGKTISSAHLSQVENGRANQSLGFLIKVAHLMDMDPRELLVEVISPQALEDLRTQVRVILEELLAEYNLVSRGAGGYPPYRRGGGGYGEPAARRGGGKEDRFERLLGLLDEELRSRGVRSAKERDDLIEELLESKAR